MSTVVNVDDHAAGSVTMSGGSSLGQFVDEEGLTQALIDNNPNRKEKHPFAVYCANVLAKAGVPNKHETRKMASYICGAIARLPFVPDEDEFQAQIEKTARRAEETLDSEMVWTGAARKLASTALEIRVKDPEGKLGPARGGAWVNAPVRGEEAS